jgi:hypothetical protein
MAISSFAGGPLPGAARPKSLRKRSKISVDPGRSDRIITFLVFRKRCHQSHDAGF